MSEQEVIKEKGVVVESLPNLRFKVKLDSGREVLAYLAGQMKRNRIKVLPGDRVVVEFSIYDKERGRIIWRET